MKLILRDKLFLGTCNHSELARVHACEPFFLWLEEEHDPPIIILNFRKWSAILAVYNLIALSKERGNLKGFSRVATDIILWHCILIFHWVTLQATKPTNVIACNTIKLIHSKKIQWESTRGIEWRAFLHVYIIIIIISYMLLISWKRVPIWSKEYRKGKRDSYDNFYCT